MTRARVLATRSSGLGDLCTAVPALRALARRFPDRELVLAAPAWQWPLAGLAGVTRIVDVHGLDPIPAELAGADLAVNLHGSGPQSIERLVALRPRELLTFRHPDVPASSHGPRWRHDEHEVARWCRLLEHAGIPTERDDLAVGVPDGAVSHGEPGCVVVHPGAAAAGRRWPAERFGTVVRHLRGRGIPVVLTGSAAEAPLCRRVATAGGRSVRSLAGATTLSDLMATVAAARAVVSNDTGVAHLAVALGTPSVVLFGPTSPARWGPPSGGAHRALWAGRPGDPHADRLDPGLARITADEVIGALDEVLQRDR